MTSKQKFIWIVVIVLGIILLYSICATSYRRKPDVVEEYMPQNLTTQGYMIMRYPRVHKRISGQLLAK